jgi:creatinine amidohydrolase/Fe(II)-dependent formamide hydrolase-like protein
VLAARKADARSRRSSVSRVAEDYNLFLLPPITLSCSHEHAGFGGSVSISSTTLHTIINDVAKSLDQQGIHTLAIVNGHGGNYLLSNVVQEANVESARMILFPHSKDWQDARTAAGCETNNDDDMHAGEAETSILLLRAHHGSQSWVELGVHLVRAGSGRAASAVLVKLQLATAVVVQHPARRPGRMRVMLVSPAHQGGNDRIEPVGLRGRQVLIPLRPLLVAVPLEHAVLDELAQPVAQHGAGDPQVLDELLEPATTQQDIANDQQRPAFTDDLQATRDRAHLVGVVVVEHTRSLPEIGRVTRPTLC